MVNDVLSMGVGNAKIRSDLFTTGVVANAARSSGVKRHATPMAAKRCSTWSTVKEIISDIADNGMVACFEVGFQAPQTAAVV